MLEFLKDVANEEFDTISFLPSEAGHIIVNGSTFREPGEKIGGNLIGDEYHIILFKLNEDGSPKDLDWFQGILGSPLEYISQLIPLDFFGVVAKSTTTSGKYAKDIFDKFTEV